MAKLKSGTRVYGTATVDTNVVVGSAVTINASGINASGIITASTFNGFINAGVSTLGVATATNLTAQQLNVSGVSTLTQISAGGTVGTAGSVLSSTGTGLSWIPAAAGGGGVNYWAQTSAGIHTLSNVGIGTTNPNYTLEVRGGIGATTLTITGVSTLTQISAGGTVGTAGSILSSTGTGLSWIPAAGGGGVNYWAQTSAGIHTLSNVGIGTTNPNYTLEVRGGIGATTLTITGVSTFAGISTFQSTLFGTQLSVSGVSTFVGITTNTSTLFTNQLSVSGVSTHIGISTFQSTLFGTQASFSGVSTHIGISTFQSTLFGTQASFSGVSTLTQISAGGTVGSAGSVLSSTGSGLAWIAAASGGGSSQWVTNSAGIHTLSNVGIGTSSPTARLSVASTSSGNSLMIVNDNLTDGSLFRVNDNSANVLMDVDANGTILFLNSGNIGIGTTLVTPTSKLHVVGNTLFTGIVTASTALSVGAGGTIITTTSTGLVGIGTTNPTSRLTVSGNALISGVSTLGTVQISSGIITATSGVVTYYGFGGNLTGIVTTNAAAGSTGQLQYNAGGVPSGTNFFNYDNTQFRVGIGTSSPTARLSVASTTTGASLMIVNDNLTDGSLFRVNDNSANVLMDVDANGTILFLNSGNVGIGTTLITPTSKLHVVGNALFTGGIVTATTFSGNLTGTAVTVTTFTATNVTLSNVNVSGITTTQTFNVGTGGTIIATTSSGNVGIGTSIPTSRFNVSVPSNGNSLMVVNDNLSDGTLFRVNDNSANVLMDVDANGTTLFPSSTGTLSIGTYIAPTTLKFNVVGGAYISTSVGIGTTNPLDRLTILGRTQIQQDSSSNNRLVLRGQPGSLYRWSVDNFGSSNTFRIFREDDATAASGNVGLQIDPAGNTTIAGITTIGLGSTSTPVANSQMSFELTSNTNLRIKVRGTDGVLRSANITLA